MVLCMHNLVSDDMQRTTIVLPQDLKHRAFKHARKLGISFAKFTQQSLEKAINEPAEEKTSKKNDPFFSNRNFWKGDVSSNLSTSIDDEIYNILEEEQTRIATYRRK